MKKRPLPCPAGYKLGQDGSCRPIPPPPAPINAPWWPSGYTGWTGPGSNSFVRGESLAAYAPASCTTIGGGQVANGQRDSVGNICFAYTFEVNIQFTDGSTGCKTLYVSANEISGGVIVGYTNGLESNIPNGQPVLISRSISPQGHADLTLELTEIDCYAT